MRVRICWILFGEVTCFQGQAQPKSQADNKRSNGIVALKKVEFGSILHKVLTGKWLEVSRKASSYLCSTLS